jgi:death-on-curing protein
VLYLHESAIKNHGGSFGIRDMGLLESALARPQNYYAYGERDRFLLAAAYAEGIARNHPFIDGNKRTAYATAGLFLFANGYLLNIPSVPAQISLFENLSMGQVNREELGEFYRQNTRQR